MKSKGRKKMNKTYLYHWDNKEWIDQYTFGDRVSSLSLIEKAEMVGESIAYSEQIVKLARELGGLPAVAEVLGIEVRKIENY